MGFSFDYCCRRHQCAGPGQDLPYSQVTCLFPTWCSGFSEVGLPLGVKHSPSSLHTQSWSQHEKKCWSGAPEIVCDAVLSFRLNSLWFFLSFVFNRAFFVHQNTSECFSLPAKSITKRKSTMAVAAYHCGIESISALMKVNPGKLSQWCLEFEV